ncbi:MAG: DUF2309 domain-containing protein [Nitrospiraceae bacterium]|nr:DUF2309 domain-containing protein [Nitrospiraceae bacterium]
MNVIERRPSVLDKKVEAACQLIAPVWPLKNFVAVNPYFGMAGKPFWKAGRDLERITGTGLCMPREYYREQIANGRITREDLAEALRETGSSWDIAALEREMERKEVKAPKRFPLFTSFLGTFDRKEWSEFVVERISQYCAAWFDEGQSLWPLPWKKETLYRGWLGYAALDKSPWMMGLRGVGREVASLPCTPDAAIDWALGMLEVPEKAMDDYLYASLLSVGGWAAWARYLRWQAELAGKQDDTMRELLAIRLVWDALLLQIRKSLYLEKKWREALAEAAVSAAPADPAHHVDALLQIALEAGYRRQLVGTLSRVGRPEEAEIRAEAQAVFCIDVRSEIFRRALETVAPAVRTHGFAGFFGVLAEYHPLGAANPKGHLPILFNPSYRIREAPAGASEEEIAGMTDRRRHRIRVSHAWKTFKTSASSCFSFVESFGVLSVGKLLGDSLGWSRPVAHPDSKGLKGDEYERMRPVLDPPRKVSEGTEGSAPSGIPVADRPAVAEFALRNMGLIRNFSRLVLLVGHGSTTTNNPQATALDCGACAGQTGEASARIVAALLNDPATRKGLLKRGIDIPEDTIFVGGLHDTVTDCVDLYDTQTLPPSHDGDLRQLRQWLEAAGQAARMERAAFLGTAGLPAPHVAADVLRRSRDWAEVRPEWALAGNAAFIAAPRARTRHSNLAGRSFLHDYNWRDDVGFATLQLIMTAPMVVGNWINMQYYGSMVDNLRFGSGNKVLHNVVGGSIGVLEGNGGDLRVGLAMQSLHDGRRWIHEPLRLNVFVEAPQEAIDDVIARHDLVRNLIENEWISFFRISESGGHLYRRQAGQKWQEISPNS